MSGLGSDCVGLKDGEKKSEEGRHENTYTSRECLFRQVIVGVLDAHLTSRIWM